MKRRVVRIQNGLEGWRAKLECGHWVAAGSRKGPVGNEAACGVCAGAGRDEIGLSRRPR